MASNTNLRMTLEQIRAAIKISKNQWVNINLTNCYAYALGLDIPECLIGANAYTPGFISNSATDLSVCDTFTYEQLVNNIHSDLDALGIEFRKVNPSDVIDNDEWKIALFLSKYFGNIDDFHFLRLCDDGFWYHKTYYESVSNYDSSSHVISDPSKCSIDFYTYDRCYALKLTPKK